MASGNSITSSFPFWSVTLIVSSSSTSFCAITAPWNENIMVTLNKIVFLSIILLVSFVLDNYLESYIALQSYTGGFQRILRVTGIEDDGFYVHAQVRWD